MTSFFPTIFKTMKICNVTNCGRHSYASGLCEQHYKRKLKGVIPWDAPIRAFSREKYKNKTCYLPGCHRGTATQGLCQTHYKRKIKGDANWRRFVKERRGEVMALNTTRVKTRVYEALDEAARQSGRSRYQLVNDILELWERQYRDADYTVALDKSFILDAAMYATAQRMNVWSEH
jgi:hypothetical protein